MVVDVKGSQLWCHKFLLQPPSDLHSSFIARLSWRCFLPGVGGPDWVDQHKMLLGGKAVLLKMREAVNHVVIRFVGDPGAPVSYKGKCWTVCSL